MPQRGGGGNGRRCCTGRRSAAPPRGARAAGMPRQCAARWPLLALLAVGGARLANGRCGPLEIADAAVEIVPTECTFWRQAGLVRPKGSSADGKTAIKWSRDCGVPTGHKEIRFSQPGDGRMGVTDSQEARAEPVAVSDLGSQTKLTLRTCGDTESAAIESIFRTWTAPSGAVLETTSLEYAIRSSADDDAASGAAWRLMANRFPVASYVVDFHLTSNGVDFGDRVARAEIPAELVSPANRTATNKGGYSGTLCIPQPDGGKGYAPKWNIEFFTSDQAIRRAVVGTVVFKAVRDNRRSPTTGEVVDNDCRSTYLANSIGIPICLMALAVVAGLLLGTNLVSGLISLWKAYTNKVADDPDPGACLRASERARARDASWRVRLYVRASSLSLTHVHAGRGRHSGGGNI